MNTSQLTEEEIAQLLPGVTAYKITYNDGHEVEYSGIISKYQRFLQTIDE